MKRFVKNIINKKQNFEQKTFYKKLIKKDDLCFDIGANTGKKSKLFLSLNAKVISFEPQSNCKKFLNQIKNDAFSFFNYAVGDKNETKQLHLANHTEVATFSDKMIDFYTTENLIWNKTEKVIVKKLDTLIDEFSVPNFCKIDTEGFELQILSNLSYKIPIIEFEFNEAFIKETLLILEILNKLGDYQFNFTLNEIPKFINKKWSTTIETKKQIQVLQKDKLHGNLFAKLMKK